MLINTTHGELEESLLVKTEIVTDNDNEHTIATEYHLGDELVRRDVHVTLKLAAVATAEVGGL